MKGSCLCGGVGFDVNDLVGPFELCHCSRCRKASGSAYAAGIGAKTAGYRVTRGRELVHTYAVPVTESPPPYRVFFCSRCGSNVPNPAPEGDWLEIPAGLLDDEPTSHPDKHIYVDRKALWDEVHAVLPEFTMAQIRDHRKKYGRVSVSSGKSGGPLQT